MGASWATFASSNPALAAHARDRLHGRVSYLATTRRDGSPRVHPVTPVVSAAELFVFMEPTSPKGHDLRRDPRYALHCGVEDVEGGGGEVIVRGSARLVEDPATRKLAAEASPYQPDERYILFALSIQEVATTAYAETGPVRDRWTSAGP